MPTKTVIDTPRIPRLGPYSQAVRVGDLIFTAGQAGIDPATGKAAGDSFLAQARQAFTNLRILLEDAGSSMDQVVKVTCFVTEAEAFASLNELFADSFPLRHQSVQRRLSPCHGDLSSRSKPSPWRGDSVRRTGRAERQRLRSHGAARFLVPLGALLIGTLLLVGLYHSAVWFWQVLVR